MRKNINITAEQTKQFLDCFYQYFETGYDFEIFLKVYLEKMGLSEVAVTQKSNDGGIDLTAVRYGIDLFDQADLVRYYVQAKRNKPGSIVPIEKVRALRGVMPAGSKGIFITTARFSGKTVEFAQEDKERLIILIDGKKLIESCIEKEIGFVYTPQFSESAMDELMLMNERRQEGAGSGDHAGSNFSENARSGPNAIEDMAAENASDTDCDLVVKKDITANDIRARILRIPKAVLDRVPADAQTLTITIDGAGPRSFKLNSSRSYVSAGIAGIYRAKGLITEDGAYRPRPAIWTDRGNGEIFVTIEDLREQME